jgi:hypothetical protein
MAVRWSAVRRSLAPSNGAPKLLPSLNYSMKRIVRLSGGAFDGKEISIPAEVHAIAIPHRGVKAYEEFVYEQSGSDPELFCYVRQQPLCS